MKFNYAFVSRVLIALLFVIAGIGKLTSFTATATMIGNLGVPLPTVVAVIVILIEIPVALAFAYGYRVKRTGWILMGFTILATLLVHRNIGDQMQMIMALKNIAIIGGIMAAIKCTCEDCSVHSKRG
jgi:putative oxidoreductase